MKIVEDRRYYIDEYKTFNEFLKSLMIVLKNKKIKKITPYQSFSRSSAFSDRIYNCCKDYQILFEDNSVLIFNYTVFSMIYIRYTHFDWVEDNIQDEITNCEKCDFDCYGEFIVDYELNRFSDEYIIEPSRDTSRPEGGDYFKEIIFHLSNNKKLCICAENAEADGECDIWMENDNLRGVFNGDSHKAWWN